MTQDDALFQDWKKRAEQRPLLETARGAPFNAQLKRAGTEWIGACPACGGRDRFGINPAKRKWICRNADGGSSVVGMVMHIGRMSVQEARQFLTGEPPPRGEAKPLSAEKLAEIEARRANEERRRLEEEEENRKSSARRRSAAGDLWRASVPIEDTLAERYLIKRGIPVPPMGWGDCVRFCPSHQYGLDHSKSFPVLVARVDGMDGNPMSVWRIYLDPKTADKAPVENAKLGLGDSMGGAVRIGGVADRIDVGEGLENSYAARFLTSYRRPVWSGLSTAGVQNMEFPLQVSRITIWPDGDLPVKQDGDQLVLTGKIAPGIDAAYKLRDRVAAAGLIVGINEPPYNGDFLDVLRNTPRDLLQ